MFLSLFLEPPFLSGWHEERHTYCVLNKGFLFQNMG